MTEQAAITPKEHTAEYMPNLDGLRGLACLFVVLSHIRLWYDVNIMNVSPVVGGLGVVIFFALSGFLMGKLYLHKPFTPDGGAKFAISRITRIALAYLIAVVIVFVVSQIWPDAPYHAGIKEFIRLLAFSSSLGYFWSIPPEVQFYAVFLFIWFAATSFRNGKYVWAALLALLSCCLFLTSQKWPGISVFSKYHIFFFGVMLSVIIRNEIVRRVLARQLVQLVLVIAAVVYFCVFLAHSTLNDYIYNDLIFACLVAVMVASLSVSTWMTKCLRVEAMHFLGNASFSIYLLHYPVMVVTHAAGTSAGLDNLQLAPIYGALGVGLPSLFHVYVEKPLNEHSKAFLLTLKSRIGEKYPRLLGA